MALRGFLTSLVICCAGIASAQSVVTTENGTGAMIKALDTITGEVSEMEISAGTTIRYERLEITLRECRYPADNIAADAFAKLLIVDERRAEPSFDGWMVASSPALSAMEHPRYDVWVIRCTTSS
jgi:hypothetical protein